MLTERQVQEIIARCAGIMVFYHNSERCEASSLRMVAEVQVVGREIMGLDLSSDGLERLLLRPLAAELIDRYGHEVGPRLHAAFLEAFDSQIVGRADASDRKSAQPDAIQNSAKS